MTIMISNLAIIFLLTLWGLCNIGYPPETHIKPKSRETLSAYHNLILSYLIIFKFCPEHSSDSAVLGAKFKRLKRML